MLPGAAEGRASRGRARERGGAGCEPGGGGPSPRTAAPAKKMAAAGRRVRPGARRRPAFSSAGAAACVLGRWPVLASARSAEELGLDGSAPGFR